ncbi:MAG: A/G-specific adenine glycosylase [Chitinophagaceae bacterium]
MKTIFTKQLIYWHLHKNQRQPIGVGETDPYKVWIREIILQQTRVEQATSYYYQLLKTFPSVKSLSNAPEDEVFKVWEGLGYYNRCRNMIQTAKYISKECNGYFPTTYEGWISLKGIGEYTAAAMMSFCYNQSYAVVDGNVNRVLSRYFGIYTDVLSSKGKKEILDLAQQLIDAKQPAIYNQAIMDFGATVCTPKNTLCMFCILNKHCYALKNNQVEVLPVKKKKNALVPLYFIFLVVKYKSSFALQKRTEKDIWQGLYTFPMLTTKSNLSFKQLTQLVKKNYPTIAIKSMSPAYYQTLTHKKITAYFLIAETTMIVEKCQWEYVENFSDYFFPKIIKNFLKDNNL